MFFTKTRAPRATLPTWRSGARAGQAAQVAAPECPGRSAERRPERGPERGRRRAHRRHRRPGHRADRGVRGEQRGPAGRLHRPPWTAPRSWSSPPSTSPRRSRRASPRPCAARPGGSSRRPGSSGRPALTWSLLGAAILADRGRRVRADPLPVPRGHRRRDGARSARRRTYPASRPRRRRPRRRLPPPPSGASGTSGARAPRARPSDAVGRARRREQTAASKTSPTRRPPTRPRRPLIRQ